MAKTNDDGAGARTRGRSDRLSRFQNISSQAGAQSWTENPTSRSSSILTRSQSSNAASESVAGAHRSQDARPPLMSYSDLQQVSQENDTPDRVVMRIPRAANIDHERRRLLLQAIREPPVTTRTLSELDLGSIMNNIHLRADVNFDNDLHFMPIKGERGKDKRQRATEYWAALAAELQVYQFTASCRQNPATEAFHDETFEPRLPTMFSALRDLLMSLVPDRDHPSITQHLEVALIMQQISKGVLDIVGLARWLAELLKCHCAPMRDKLTDQMAVRIEEGLLDHKTETIALGLEQLFAVLEAMKLDVANHQIRTFRMLLIDDTEQFQRDHFERLINEREFDPCSPSEWYENLSQQMAHCSHSHLISFEPHDKSLQGMMPLIIGLLNNLTSFQKPKSYPSTFYHDEGRLIRLRDDIQDLTYLSICFRVFNHTIYDLSRGQQSSAPHQTYVSLRARIFAILGHSYRSAEDEITTTWQDDTASVALEILRAAYVFCNHEGRRCPSLSTGALPPISDHQAQTTYRRLVTLTQHEEHYRSFARQLESEIVQNAASQASHFNSMGPRGISEEQRIWTSRRSLQINQPDYRDQFSLGGLCLPSADIEDISRRLAHIVVLNWRVWAGLCYLPHRKAEL